MLRDENYGNSGDSCVAESKNLQHLWYCKRHCIIEYHLTILIHFLLQIIWVDQQHCNLTEYKCSKAKAGDDDARDQASPLREGLPAQLDGYHVAKACIYALPTNEEDEERLEGVSWD